MLHGGAVSILDKLITMTSKILTSHVPVFAGCIALFEHLIEPLTVLEQSYAAALLSHYGKRKNHIKGKRFRFSTRMMRKICPDPKTQCKIISSLERGTPKRGAIIERGHSYWTGSDSLNPFAKAFKLADKYELRSLDLQNLPCEIYLPINHTIATDSEPVPAAEDYILKAIPDMYAHQESEKKNLSKLDREKLYSMIDDNGFVDYHHVDGLTICNYEYAKKHKLKKWHDAIHNIEMALLLESNNYVPRKDTLRLFTPFNGTAKWIRDTLTMNGEEIVERDYASFHSNILRTVMPEEHREAFDLRIAGDTKTKMKNAGIEKPNPSKYLNMIYHTNELFRKLAEKMPEHKYFTDTFGQPISTIIPINRLSIMLYSREIHIMNTVIWKLKNLNIPCQLLHDAIAIPISKAEIAEQIMNEVALSFEIHTFAR
jgi:hypothetical protein